MEDRYLRLKEIIGDKKNGIPGYLPISKSSWWKGIRSGRFPKGTKLTPRTTGWKLSDIKKILQ